MFNRQYKKVEISKRMLIVWLVMGLGIFIIANFDIHKRWLNLENKGQITMGSITKCQPMTVNKSERAKCCYYTFKAGQDTLSFHKCDCTYNEGDSVTVRYNPKNPNENEILR